MGDETARFFCIVLTPAKDALKLRLVMDYDLAPLVCR